MPTLPDSIRSRALPVALAAAFLGAALPATAAASHSEQTIYDATKALLGTAPANQAPILNTLQKSGVDTLRLILPWRYLVPAPGHAHRPAGFDPTRPGDYPVNSWVATDAAVRGATARGMRVLLTPSSPTPNWASASGHSQYANPLPGEFHKFAIALGRRYSGHFKPQPTESPLPRVRFWSVWNEPNLDIFLKPQRRHGRTYAPTLYRRLFLAAQSGLKATGHGHDPLLIGETSPSNGRVSTNPLAFARGVLCLDRNNHRRRGCAPIYAARWAQHPYSFDVAPFRHSANPQLINLASIGKLERTLGIAKRAGATRHRLPVYVTEFGIVAVPNPGGVSLLSQVTQMAVSEYVSWRDPQIRAFANYLYKDDPTAFDFPFTTGLFTENGQAKPLRHSFPMTMLVKRDGRRVFIWGHVRPAAGRVTVSVRYRSRGSGSHLLRKIRTNPVGYFAFRSRFSPGRRWAASANLPSGPALAGPYIPAVSF